MTLTLHKKSEGVYEVLNPHSSGMVCEDKLTGLWAATWNMVPCAGSPLFRWSSQDEALRALPFLYPRPR